MGVEHFADGIVFQREQCVEQLKTNPPVVIEAGQGQSVGIARQERLRSLLIHLQLPLYAIGTDFFGRGLTRAIELGSVPPCRILVLVCWTSLVRVVKRCVGLGARQFHVARWPRIVGRKWNVEDFRALRVNTTHQQRGIRLRSLFCLQDQCTYVIMVGPVVNLELDPGGGEKVHDGGRLELALLARQQLLANDARKRLPQLFVGRLGGKLPGDIAAEAHVRTAHQRQFEGIELAIGVARGLVHGIGHRVGLLGALRLCGRIDIVQVLRTQLDAKSEEVEDADERGQLVPGNDLVHALEDLDDDAVDKTRLSRLQRRRHGSDVGTGPGGANRGPNSSKSSRYSLAVHGGQRVEMVLNPWRRCWRGGWQQRGWSYP